VTPEQPSKSAATAEATAPASLRSLEVTVGPLGKAIAGSGDEPTETPLTCRTAATRPTDNHANPLGISIWWIYTLCLSIPGSV